MFKRNSVAVVLVILFWAVNYGFAEDKASENLFKFGYEKMPDGSEPSGYIISAQDDDSVEVDAKIFAPPKGPSVRLEAKKFGYLALDSPPMKFIKKDKQYLATIKVKVKDMNIIGHWWTKRCGLWIRIFDTKSNVQTWCNLGGEGSTEGWVTVMLPFSGKKFANGSTRLLIRCEKMTGTVWVQDPVIVELPGGKKMKRSFLLADGKTITSSHLTVK